MAAGTRRWERKSVQVETLEHRLFLADGGFNALVYATGGDAWQMAAGDIDGDYDVDLVATYPWANEIGIWRNNGRGVFTEDARRYPAGNRPGLIVTADFNGDGIADLAVSEDPVDNRWDEPSEIRILQNNGKGAFRLQAAYVTAREVNRLVPADTDNDGDTDLVVLAGYYLGTLVNEGTGTFADIGSYIRWIGGWDILPADVDSDGDVDLVTDHRTVIFNDGMGRFSVDAPSGVVLMSPPVALVDVDRDRDIDIVQWWFEPGVIAILNRGEGTYAGQKTLLPGTPIPEVDWPPTDDPAASATDPGEPTRGFGWNQVRRLLSADMTGDGTADLVISTGEEDSMVEVMAFDRNFDGWLGAFLPTEKTPALAVDLDRDGDADLVTDVHGGNFHVLLSEAIGIEVMLSRTAIEENVPAGTAVGPLTVNWTDEGVTYTLVSGKGGKDNAAFAIVDNHLVTARTLDYERKRLYRVRVRATDDNGYGCERAFLIRVEDVAERSGVFGRVEGRKLALVVRDEDGDRVRFRLTGGGMAVLDEEGVVTVTGATERSVLWIGVKKAKGGDGKISLTRVDGGAVKLKARGVVWAG